MDRRKIKKMQFGVKLKVPTSSSYKILSLFVVSTCLFVNLPFVHKRTYLILTVIQ